MHVLSDNNRMLLIIRKLLRRLNWLGVFIERGGDSEPVSIVAGYTRSGTTLLVRLLSNVYRCRPVHEPLNPNVVPEIGFFNERESLGTIMSDETYQKTLRYVFSRDFRGTKDTNIGTRLRYCGRIVKIVRGNHYLSYIANLYDESPIVFIMRNPVKCVTSRVRLGWAVPDFSSCYRDIEPCLNQQQKDACMETEDTVGRMALSWCLDNYMALQNESDRRFLFVHYENLLLEPQRELARISRHLGRELDEKDLNRELEMEQLPVSDSEQLFRSLNESVSGEYTRIWEFAECFGLAKYYTSNTGVPARIPPFTDVRDV